MKEKVTLTTAKACGFILKEKYLGVGGDGGSTYLNFCPKSKPTNIEEQPDVPQPEHFLAALIPL